MLPLWFALLVLQQHRARNGQSHARDRDVERRAKATLLNVLAIAILLYIPFTARTAAPQQSGSVPPTGWRAAAAGVHRHLAARRLVYEIGLTVAGLVISAATVRWPTAFPRTLTTGAIVYVAMGFWPLWGSRLFIAWPRLHGWPSFWLLPVALALVFCQLERQPRDRRCNVRKAHRPRLTALDDSIRTWHDTHNCVAKAPCQMRIVAAEGGGLRAAYWTAAILRGLDDNTSEDFKFGRSVFAISTISGGSLGAVGYYGALRLQRPTCHAAENLHKYLGDDHLSPVMASLLFGNAFQWLWPARIGALDRARAFEANMADLWKDHLLNEPVAPPRTTSSTTPSRRRTCRARPCSL